MRLKLLLGVWRQLITKDRTGDFLSVLTTLPLRGPWLYVYCLCRWEESELYQ